MALLKTPWRGLDFWKRQYSKRERVGEREGEDGVPRLGYLQRWNSSAASVFETR